ncbi:disease resistance protein RGA2-like [Bidens hawaiensis]|uniref:disease resistance protein RGA2-like n=1 Tax=Bidens hawaiensis TaxID=980011 RepID=UPI0040494632
MGVVVVSDLVKDVLGRLTSIDIQEFGLLWVFKDDILALKDDFDRIEAVLQDAEHKHNKEKAVELWLKSVKSASLEVENVLDEISTEALLQRLHKEKGIVSSVSAFFSSDHNPLMFQARIGYKVKAIRTKLDVIASKIVELKLTSLVAVSHVDVGVECEMPDRETSSIIHSSVIVGRGHDANMVIDKICNKDIGKHENGEIRMYGIWGVGGVGKTTLAHMVYSHERVNQYFELKLWMNVSERLQVKEIIKGIIESIDKRKCGLPQLDMLQESLQSKLKGKKFLIVLDDIWIEDSEKTQWDQLSETLSCGAEGSIVVITTRSQTTCRMMAKFDVLQHELGCLSKEDAWLLFKKLAFAEGREGDDINDLEPIGREIVGKCKGLPLAVKTLGGLMWSKRSRIDWQGVNDNNIWELQESNVLPAIKLSYDYLLPHLKRCFAYCCLFPKGYEMEKDILISLWVSNGFIPPRGEINLYVLGEEIFNCLVWRSFLSKVEKFSVDRYIMHDLIHDIARHVTGDDCLVIQLGKNVIIPNEVFHLSSSCPNFRFSPQDLGKLASLRSIFMYGNMNEDSISQVFNHVYLRVLYLPGIWLKTLPESICKLKHLKFLNLSYSGIEVLPDSIIYLQNLQVLLLYSCKKLRELPESVCELKQLSYMNLSHSSIEALPESIIYLRNLQVLLLDSCPLFKLPEGLRNMRNLQHLDIGYSLTHLPLGIKELTNLRKLSMFRLGSNSGAKIGELGDLNLLEGELQIVPLESVGGYNEAKTADLKCKRNLQVLMLRWSGIRVWDKRGSMRVAHDEDVLEGLEPNSNLKELKIFFYMGKTVSPSWMDGLRNLVEINFYSCKNCEHIPPLGRLPNLRVIRLSIMDSLKCFDDERDSMVGNTTNMFLCLKKLDVYNCPNLISLPSNLPKLEALRLVECDKLLSLPDEIQSFKNLNKLVIFDCKVLSKRCEKEIGVDWHKISHIPNIRTHSPR